jgi:hypothetical protein
MKRVKSVANDMIPLSFSSSNLEDMEKEWAPTAQTSDMRKSSSEPLLSSEVTIEFEGDGPLGIVWGNRGNDAYVVGITDSTVSAEEIDLKIGYKLIQIGDYNCSHISYSDIMNLIRLKWQKFSQITLTFYTDTSDLDFADSDDSNEEQDEEQDEGRGLLEECLIYKFLRRHNAESFYDSFKLLGALRLEDLEYIQYQDLVNMRMGAHSRKSISGELGLTKANVYFSPHLSKGELETEKSKYDKSNSNFIEIHPPNR